MDPDLEKKLSDLEVKLAVVYRSVEKTRKYFFWTLIISIAAIVLPLVGISLVIPTLLSSFSAYSGV